MNVARQAALKAGLPVEVPAETVNRVCGSGLQAVVHAVEAIRVGLRRHGRRRRHRVDVERAVPAEGRALGLSDGPRRGRRLDAGRRADLRDQRAATWASRPRRSPARFGVSRADQDAFAAESQRRAGRGRSPTAASQARSWPSRFRRRRATRSASTTDEYPRAAPRSRSWRRSSRRSRRTASVTAGNASGINDGAAALVVTTRRDGAGSSATRRWRASCRTRRPASIRRSWAWAGAGRAQGARARGPDDRRHRSVRAERGVRGAVARRRPRARPRPGEGQRATAAPSRSAIRSAPAARAC